MNELAKLVGYLRRDVEGRPQNRDLDKAADELERLQGALDAHIAVESQLLDIATALTRATGGLDPALVAKALTVCGEAARWGSRLIAHSLTADDIAALKAATFEDGDAA